MTYLYQCSGHHPHLGQHIVLFSKTIHLKFGFSEKHTKFEKIFLMVLTNQLIYLVNVKTMRKIFSNYVYFSKVQNLNHSPYKLQKTLRLPTFYVLKNTLWQINFILVENWNTLYRKDINSVYCYTAGMLTNIYITYF